MLSISCSQPITEDSSNNKAEFPQRVSCMLTKTFLGTVLQSVILLTQSSFLPSLLYRVKPPHIPVPSSFCLTGICRNDSLVYLILSWHVLLMEPQTNTTGIHTAECCWRSVYSHMQTAIISNS